MSRIHRLAQIALHIPVHGTIEAPLDDGSPGMLVFYGQDEFFLIPLELYQLLDQFVVPVTAAEPPPPTPVVEIPKTPKQIREEMVALLRAGDAPKWEAPVDRSQLAALSEMPPPTPPTPRRTSFAALGISEEVQQSEHHGVYKVEDAGRDGLDFDEAMLRELVDICYDGNLPSHIRQQAFVKLADCPVPVLLKSRKYMDADPSQEGLAYRIAYARSVRLSLGEAYISLPNDMSAFVLDTEIAMPTSVAQDKIGYARVDLEGMGGAVVPTPDAKINSTVVAGGLPTRQTESAKVLEARAMQSRNMNIPTRKVP